MVIFQQVHWICMVLKPLHFEILPLLQEIVIINNTLKSFIGVVLSYPNHRFQELLICEV